MVRVGVSALFGIVKVILRNLLTVGQRVLLNPYATVGHRDTAYIF